MSWVGQTIQLETDVFLDNSLEKYLKDFRTTKASKDNREDQQKVICWWALFILMVPRYQSLREKKGTGLNLSFFKSRSIAARESSDSVWKTYSLHFKRNSHFLQPSWMSTKRISIESNLRLILPGHSWAEFLSINSSGKQYHACVIVNQCRITAHDPANSSSAGLEGHLLQFLHCTTLQNRMVVFQKAPKALFTKCKACLFIVLHQEFSMKDFPRSYIVCCCTGMTLIFKPFDSIGPVRG